MTSIPDATNVLLTEEERAELDALARSTKTEHRLRQRARIVLLAAEGVATRAIGREVGCTTGTARPTRASTSPTVLPAAAEMRYARAWNFRYRRLPAFFGASPDKAASSFAASFLRLTPISRGATSGTKS